MLDIEQRENIDIMRIFVYLEDHVGEDIIFLKDAAEYAGVNFIDIERKKMLSMKFRMAHPEYKEYRMYNADVPVSWQSLICYTVFVKREIYDAQYMLVEAINNISPGEKLRRLRLQAGMSIKELAEATNLSYRTIQCLETNVRNINAGSVQTTKKLAEALKVSIDELID